VELSKLLQEKLEGFSPFYAGRSPISPEAAKTRRRPADRDAKRAAPSFLSDLFRWLSEGGGTPTMASSDGRPREFSFLPIRQYGRR
jgi:hypothetical protein